MDRITALSKNMNDLANLFTSKFAQFEKSIPPAPQDNSTLASEFYAFKDFIMTAVSNLKTQIEIIYHSLEDMEMKSRSNILLLHGLLEKDDEDLTQHFTSICNNQLQLASITADSFTACHRIGRNMSAEKPRPVLIRFSHSKSRQEIWLAKSKLKGTGLTLSEFLTPARHALFLEARKALGVKGCWTMDGRIVAICPDGKRKRIGTMSDLAAVIAMRGAPSSGQPMEPKSGSSGIKGAGGEKPKNPSAQAAPESTNRAPNPPRAVRAGGSSRGGKAPNSK
ncbi:hypothetical protein NE865_09839 [Phthorimaea operculella]|nr:hypothetical protein NE865_09839 [Phthorimaea operculella]